MGMTASDSLVVEDSDDVAAAAYRYRQGGVGFSDLMILKAAERANAAPLHTFDHRLARMRGATLVVAPKGRRLMADRKPKAPQRSVSGKRRGPTLDDVWPVHSAGGWPQDLSLDRADIYEGRT